MPTKCEEGKIKSCFYLRRQGEYEEKCQCFTVVALLPEQERIQQHTICVQIARTFTLCTVYTPVRGTTVFIN